MGNWFFRSIRDLRGHLLLNKAWDGIIDSREPHDGGDEFCRGNGYGMGVTRDAKPQYHQKVNGDLGAFSEERSIGLTTAVISTTNLWKISLLALGPK